MTFECWAEYWKVSGFLAATRVETISLVDGKVKESHFIFWNFAREFKDGVYVVEGVFLFLDLISLPLDKSAITEMSVKVVSDNVMT